MQTPGRSAQSTIEYLLFLAGVIGVIVFFMGPGSAVRQKIYDTFRVPAQGMSCVANKVWRGAAACNIPKTQPLP